MTETALAKERPGETERGRVGDKDRGFRCGAHIGEGIEAVVDEEWRVRPQILLLLQGTGFRVEG